MKLTYYRSNKYEKTETVEVVEILGNFEPDEMTPEDRVAFRNGDMHTMCCYTTPEGTGMSVPWDFVIKIEE